MATAELFLAAAWTLDVFLNPVGRTVWVQIVSLFGIAVLVVAATRELRRAARASRSN
jgi:hypothetical protein